MTSAPLSNPGQIDTYSSFLQMGERISKDAGVFETFYNYFFQQAARLWKSCEHFDLLSSRLGNVLEIGPFYGFIPFLLRARSESYQVLEGDDPAVYPLKPLYEQNAITMKCVDFFDDFGPVHGASRRLPFPDESFDTILCWETLEHFNFNPVPFVREIHRILKKGGRACVTVPNRRSYMNLLAMILGFGQRATMDSYFHFENYESGGKKAFYGFHWHEYGAIELDHLFRRAGFTQVDAQNLTAFQNRESATLSRRIARALAIAGTKVLPQFGSSSVVSAIK
jgi:SAM-dependent methyltransferase